MSPDATVREKRSKVQQERGKIINALGALQCVKLAIRAEELSGDIDGAVELIEEELQRTINALDPVNLGRNEEASEAKEAG